MIAAVDLMRGLAALVGWRRIDVPGATGYLDTDYAAKGRYAVAALERRRPGVRHVEATDEASHEGNAAAKIEPWRRSTATSSARSRGAAAPRRLPHPGHARPSHAAADEDAQPTATCPSRPADDVEPDAATSYTSPRPAVRASPFPKAGG